VHDPCCICVMAYWNVAAFPVDIDPRKQHAVISVKQRRTQVLAGYPQPSCVHCWHERQKKVLW
jgi:hypothetical protein